MVRGLRQRMLEKLAYLFWLKDKNRSSEQNWKLALEAEKNLIEKNKNVEDFRDGDA